MSPWKSKPMAALLLTILTNKTYSKLVDIRSGSICTVHKNRLQLCIFESSVLSFSFRHGFMFFYRSSIYLGWYVFVLSGLYAFFFLCLQGFAFAVCNLEVTWVCIRFILATEIILQTCGILWTLLGTFFFLPATQLDYSTSSSTSLFFGETKP